MRISDWSSDVCSSDLVFIPYEHVLMDGEYEFAQEMVTRFTAYHRASYVCKTGLGDVMVGAAAQVADYNGAEAASHIKDKLVEMTHLNETIYSSAIASSHEAKPLASRSEEHTSELQSLMRISYAVFCLKKTKQKNDIHNYIEK